MKYLKHGIPRVVSGWAIDSNYTDIDGKVYHGFLGWHYFHNNPKVLEGAYNVLGVVVWPTREDARLANSSHKTGRYIGNPNSKVVAVKVEMSIDH